MRIPTAAEAMALIAQRAREEAAEQEHRRRTCPLCGAIDSEWNTGATPDPELQDVLQRIVNLVAAE